MSLDRLVFAFAGGMILISLGLSLLVSPAFLWLTAFVGANLIQAAFTGFCPVARLFKRLGAKPGCAFE